MEDKIRFGCERRRFGIDLNHDRAAIVGGKRQGRRRLDNSRCADRKEDITASRRFDRRLKLVSWKSLSEPDDIRAQQPSAHGTARNEF